MPKILKLIKYIILNFNKTIQCNFLKSEIFLTNFFFILKKKSDDNITFKKHVHWYPTRYEPIKTMSDEEMLVAFIFALILLAIFAVFLLHCWDLFKEYKERRLKNKEADNKKN